MTNERRVQSTSYLPFESQVWALIYYQATAMLSWLTYIYAAELLLLDERLSSLLINYMANYYTELFLSRTNIVVRAKY